MIAETKIQKKGIELDFRTYENGYNWYAESSCLHKTNTMAGQQIPLTRTTFDPFAFDDWAFDI